MNKGYSARLTAAGNPESATSTVDPPALQLAG